MSSIETFENGAIILLDKEETGSIVINETAFGEKITSIGGSACQNGKVKYLDIRSTSIKTIGVNAFMGCRFLTNISLPDSLTTICRDAFRGCPIRTLHIPKLLSNINGAFNHCGELKTFTKDEENNNFDIEKEIVYSKDHKRLIRGSNETQFEDITYIDVIEEMTEYCLSKTAIRTFQAGPSLLYLKDGVFETCVNLIDVNLVQSKVQKIYSYCFRNANIMHLTLPPKLLKIAAWAFDCCNISLLQIPSSVKSIESGAFNAQKGKFSIFYFGKNSFEGIKFFEGCAVTPKVYVPFSYKSENLSTVSVIKCDIDRMFIPLRMMRTRCFTRTSRLFIVQILLLCC